MDQVSETDNAKPFNIRNIQNWVCPSIVKLSDSPMDIGSSEHTHL
jgi:hypothetical protein